MDSGELTGAGVLANKRDATQYRILVQIAKRQPAVSQQEVADAIGVTSQAVSNYLQDLVERGHVRKHGRGRYEVTKEGVDWLMTRTDELAGFTRHVSEEVVGQVEIETAIATADVEEGQRVSMSMRDGVQRATPGDAGDATAVAVTDAEAGQDVGVTDFEGVLDYELGHVTILTVPRVQDGGSAAVDPERIADEAADHDRAATAGTEAVAAAEAADVSVAIQFGTRLAVTECAAKGLDVLLLVTADRLAEHTDELRSNDVGYEVLDAA